MVSAKNNTCGFRRPGLFLREEMGHGVTQGVKYKLELEGWFEF